MHLFEIFLSFADIDAPFEVRGEGREVCDDLAALEVVDGIVGRRF
jgi:hypothetical protein